MPKNILAQCSLPKREEINYDHPDSLETELLVKQLHELKSGKSVEIPAYDFSTHMRKKKGKIVAPAKAVNIEGILIFSDQAISTTAYFLSFPSVVIGNPLFSMRSGFRVKPGMTAERHEAAFFIEKFAVVLGN